MKKKKVICIMMAAALTLQTSITVSAQPEGKEQSPAAAVTEKEGEEALEQPEQKEETVLRNTVFTTTEQMGQLMNTTDPSMWSARYLTEVEQSYWNFSAPGEQDKRELSMNMVSNAYQNLEMFLDNGYLLDYYELAAYAADYLERRGEKDAYYEILTDCLKNPYLLNRPKAQVTDYTYNGRDYSAVFDPDYYYDANPDLQATIGFQPPELLRHFVEKGIMEGRKGNASVDMDAYIAYTDGEIALNMQGAQVPGQMPAVAKYSYSRASYYGKMLGHYDYSAIYMPESEERPADSDEENVADW